MSSLKSAKETLEKGNPSSSGKVLDVTEKNDQFLINYHLSSNLPNPEDQKKLCYIQEVFNSVGFQHDNLVEVIGYAIEEILIFVRRCPPGFVLKNRTTYVIPTVFPISK